MGMDEQGLGGFDRGHGQEAMVLLQHQRRRRLQEEAAARRQMFDGKEFTPIS